MNERISRAGRLLAVLASFPLLTAGECDDGPPTGTDMGEDPLTFPAAWAGTYRVERESTPPTGGGDLVSQTTIDIVCEDTEPFLDLFARDVDLQCIGMIDDDTADIQCVGSSKLYEGCTQTVETSFVASRTTNGFSGTQVVRTILEGKCVGGETADTTTTQLAAQRIAAESPGCGQDLADGVPPSWAGDWEFSLTEIDCKTGETTDVIASFSRLFCPGEPPTALLDLPESPDETLENTMTWGGFGSDRVDAFFSERRLGGACDSAMTTHVDLARDGESIDGRIETIEYVFASESSCEETARAQCFRLTATRVSTDTDGCSPVP